MDYNYGIKRNYVDYENDTYVLTMIGNNVIFAKQNSVKREIHDPLYSATLNESDYDTVLKVFYHDPSAVIQKMLELE